MEQLSNPRNFQLARVGVALFNESPAEPHDDGIPGVVSSFSLNFNLCTSRSTGGTPCRCLLRDLITGERSQVVVKRPVTCD